MPERTGDEAEFADLVTRLSPDSPPRQIKRAFALLKKGSPMQHQLGLQHIAESCWLSVMHLIDAHMVSFVDDSTWSECEYYGAAYCMPGDDEDWKTKLLSLPRVPGEGRLALFRKSVAENPYTGAGRGQDQLHTLLKPHPEALLTLPVADIPVGRENDQHVLDLSRDRHERYTASVREITDAARASLQSLEGSTLSWMFYGKTIGKLQALIEECQRMHRELDAKRVRVQARVYHSILTEVEPVSPVKPEHVDGKLFSALRGQVEDIQKQAHALKLKTA